jgi:hypothetical protein
MPAALRSLAFTSQIHSISLPKNHMEGRRRPQTDLGSYSYQPLPVKPIGRSCVNQVPDRHKKNCFVFLCHLLDRSKAALDKGSRSGQSVSASDRPPGSRHLRHKRRGTVCVWSSLQPPRVRLQRQQRSVSIQAQGRHKTQTSGIYGTRSHNCCYKFLYGITM